MFLRISPLTRHRFYLGMLVLLWAGVLCSIAGLLFLIYIQLHLPDPSSITDRQIRESTKIYDRTGTVLLYDIYKEERRTIVPWEEIAQSVRDATVAAEDASFYSHRGLDIKGILRAFLRDIQTGSLAEGGSTITQQLVKKALLTDQKAFSRKIRELLLAIEIERQLTKEEILWMYLNQIPYGSNTYGVEAASQQYFGIHASELSVAQAAYLAAVANAPSRLSPYGTHLDELDGRQQFVLSRMHDLGFIDDNAYRAAKGEKVAFRDKSSQLNAPHFVLMIKEYLEEKYGEDVVSGVGFKVITTLDADLQKTAETLVAQYAEVNAQKYKATNAALVSVDPRSGHVLALVGSRNYFDTAQEGNFNVATAKRQPGSAFKPFAYITAFEKGFPDTTLLFDQKTEFNPSCPGDGSARKDQYGLDCYHPQNYDGRYHGVVTLRDSLAQSLNIPSVQTLYLAGISNTITTAERMGITTLQDRERFGLSLVLGGAEVRLVDLVSAYGVFANDGIRNPWTIVQSVTAPDGTVLESFRSQESRVINEQPARLINSILSDNNARAPVFGANSPLFFGGRQVAAKTGTTQNNRDAWVVGYTPSLVTGVWVGNNNNTPMTAAGAGISAGGPLWHAFMNSALQKTPIESFLVPDPVSVSKIFLNGTLPSGVDENGFPVEPHSILYYVNLNDPLGPFPSNPASDPQFANWEAVVHRQYSLP